MSVGVIEEIQGNIRNKQLLFPKIILKFSGGFQEELMNQKIYAFCAEHQRLIVGFSYVLELIAFIVCFVTWREASCCADSSAWTPSIWLLIHAIAATATSIWSTFVAKGPADGATPPNEIAHLIGFVIFFGFSLVWSLVGISALATGKDCTDTPKGLLVWFFDLVLITVFLFSALVLLAIFLVKKYRSSQDSLTQEA